MGSGEQQNLGKEWGPMVWSLVLPTHRQTSISLTQQDVLLRELTMTERERQQIMQRNNDVRVSTPEMMTHLQIGNHTVDTMMQLSLMK